jgi:hypothetical protein
MVKPGKKTKTTVNIISEIKTKFTSLLTNWTDLLYYSALHVSIFIGDIKKVNAKL